jgi:hypothetical protein
VCSSDLFQFLMSITVLGSTGIRSGHIDRVYPQLIIVKL